MRRHGMSYGAIAEPKPIPRLTAERIEAHRAYLRDILEEVMGSGDKAKALGK